MSRTITVVSGKGGTGKTSLTALWGIMARDAVLADADVDASNLPLAYRHTVRERHTFVGRNVAVVDHDACTDCGICAEVCRFEAFVTVNLDGAERYDVDPLRCEGCTLCSLACPSGAISMVPHESGEWFVSETEYGPLVHAQLGIAEGNSGKLVTEVRRAAEHIAESNGRETILVDGPPGIGCQTIAALTGADLAVVVTEPSASGRHDMARVLSVIARLGVSAKVVLNKADLAPNQVDVTRRTAREAGAEFIGIVPFFPDVPRSLALGTFTKSPPMQMRAAAARLWSAIKESAEAS